MEVSPLSFLSFISYPSVSYIILDVILGVWWLVNLSLCAIQLWADTQSTDTIPADARRLHRVLFIACVLNALRVPDVIGVYGLVDFSYSITIFTTALYFHGCTFVLSRVFHALYVLKRKKHAPFYLRWPLLFASYGLFLVTAVRIIIIIIFVTDPLNRPPLFTVLSYWVLLGVHVVFLTLINVSFWMMRASLAVHTTGGSWSANTRRSITQGQGIITNPSSNDTLSPTHALAATTRVTTSSLGPIALTMPQARSAETSSALPHVPSSNRLSRANESRPNGTVRASAIGMQLLQPNRVLQIRQVLFVFAVTVVVVSIALVLDMVILVNVLMSPEVWQPVTNSYEGWASWLPTEFIFVSVGSVISYFAWTACDVRRMCASCAGTWCCCGGRSARVVPVLAIHVTAHCQEDAPPPTTGDTQPQTDSLNHVQPEMMGGAVALDMQHTHAPLVRTVPEAQRKSDVYRFEPAATTTPKAVKAKREHHPPMEPLDTSPVRVPIPQLECALPSTNTVPSSPPAAASSRPQSDPNSLVVMRSQTVYEDAAKPHREHELPDHWSDLESPSASLHTSRVKSAKSEGPAARARGGVGTGADTFRSLHLPSAFNDSQQQLQQNLEPTGRVHASESGGINQPMVEPSRQSALPSHAPTNARVPSLDTYTPSRVSEPTQTHQADGTPSYDPASVVAPPAHPASNLALNAYELPPLPPPLVTTDARAAPP